MMATRRKTLTLRQVAKLAGTSKSTVSRVLTKHPSVAPETRARVEAVIRRRGFEPNLFARGLAGGPSGLVAVLAPEINSGFYAEVMRGINAAAAARGGHLLSCIAHGTEDFVRLWQTFARGRRVDGIVLLAPPDAIFRHAVSRSAVPIVLCACSGAGRGGGWEKVDSATVRNDEGITALMRHLADQGRKFFLHMSGPDDAYDAQARRAAFEAFVAQGQDLRGEVVLTGQNREDGYQAILRYLERTGAVPDAIVCFNDSTAYGVLQALTERQIAVPDRTAVTGCDDEPASATLGLTSLRMPMRELGEAACELLFARLGEKGSRAPAEHRTFGLVPVLRSSSVR